VDELEADAGAGGEGQGGAQEREPEQGSRHFCFVENTLASVFACCVHGEVEGVQVCLYNRECIVG
jgi:hypothetical protein